MLDNFEKHEISDIDLDSVVGGTKMYRMTYSKIEKTGDAQKGSVTAGNGSMVYPEGVIDQKAEQKRQQGYTVSIEYIGDK